VQNEKNHFGKIEGFVYYPLKAARAVYFSHHALKPFAALCFREATYLTKPLSILPFPLQPTPIGHSSVF